jgi:hypothetical protein
MDRLPDGRGSRTPPAQGQDADPSMAGASVLAAGERIQFPAATMAVPTGTTSKLPVSHDRYLTPSSWAWMLDTWAVHRRCDSIDSFSSVRTLTPITF